DLCATHASRITAPKGWEMVRHEGGFSTTPDDDDLTALAEAVREAGLRRRSPEPDRHGYRDYAPPPQRTSRTGRRGHLRVLPDPPS
ncbi:hypothetical protein B0T44_24605, partial [Nocardia donostiensis]